MSITTTSVLSAPVQQSFSYKLLSVPVPNLIHNIPAMLKQMPRNGGTTLRMRRYSPLKTSPVQLGVSGIEGPAAELTAINLDAVINFYGQYILLNEQVTLQAQDPVLNEAAQRLGVSLRQTEDQLTREMLRSSASSIFCTGGVNADLPSEITRSDVDEVIRTLVTNDAHTISESIGGEDKFGTAPVRDAYFSMCSSKIIGDLENVSGFIAKTAYPSPMDVLREEWGSISNLRFLISSVGSVDIGSSALGNDVLNVFCCGLEAYTVVEQDGYSSQFIYRPPIFSGPLAMNVSVGWKMGSAQLITNDAWVLNLKTTLST